MDYKTFNQELIDYLIELDKLFEDNDIVPATMGEKKSFSLTSSDSRCFFSLDMNRASRIEAKLSMQTRYLNNNQWLIRLELNGPPHTNPDGTVTNRDHIHVIQEKDGKILNIGYNLDEFDELLFKHTKNINKVFRDFCQYCNIKITGNYQEIL
ncbi:DUF6978 family protein [Tepidimicrobium xylanilyticum]|uniref:Uncharacterized protein n=1 Tax=Tepidimicrobium xylanilyticum TaxID=1123352 RepID=A0A1H3E8W3_9FIRM|nr:hypothetical protein [Tepidimicrobium xylanilyticum]SDX75121.1 hypothetical protein SAMN05660923_02867 [Tepidimicrobium xylanilyticum]